MATGRPWMAWYPRDIMTDAKYLVLSRSAKLTYRELLDHAWMEGGVLPSEERKLAALAGLTLDQFREDWQELQDPEAPCFMPHPHEEGKLTNKRLLVEWRKANGQQKTAQENGKKGGRPRKQRKEKTDKKTKAVFSGNPNKSNTQPQPQSETQTQEEQQPPPKTRDGKGTQEPPNGTTGKGAQQQVVVADEIKELRKRYTDQELLDDVLTALKSTRKNFSISDGIVLAELRWWERYPADLVQACMQVYLDGDHAAQGRAEKYLRGIIRNHKNDERMTQRGLKMGRSGQQPPAAGSSVWDQPL